MSENKKIVETGVEPSYPTLDEYRCERRRFLRHVAFGTLSLGLGGSLLVRCTSSGTTLTGNTPIGNPLPIPVGAPVTVTPALPHGVRLPGEGFDGVYMNYYEYLSYAVTFTTRDGEFASWFQTPEGAQAGLAAMNAVLAPLSCNDVTLADLRPATIQHLREALEECFAGATGSAPGAWIDSLDLLVDSCEEIGVAGDMAEHAYP